MLPMLDAVKADEYKHYCLFTFPSSIIVIVTVIAVVVVVVVDVISIITRRPVLRDVVYWREEGHQAAEG